MVLVAAFLGWMFDGLEQGLIPITAPAALRDFMPSASDAKVAQMISYLTAAFLAGAAIGGVLFGWLGDRFGRVRTMAVTILAYSLFMGCGYFASSPFQLGLFQFLAALGMGGEWALGVALIMECWPERLRPMLAGVIGAAANFGFLLIALIGVLHPIRHDSWRWVMLAGAAPAVLACLVLAFIPESQRWKDAVRAGGSRPMREIFTTHLFWRVLLATAFASVALIGTWAAVASLLPNWANDLAGGQHPKFKAVVQCLTATGAILGCVTAPIVGGKIGRRPAYFILCVLSLSVCTVLFRVLRVPVGHPYNGMFLLFCFLAGLTTAAFYGWLPLYLPELFPTRVRATAQGMSYNFGRVFALIGVLGMSMLLQHFGGKQDPRAIPNACAVITLVYLVGMVLIWLAPETKGKPLPE
jgi:MFS family permease